MAFFFVGAAIPLSLPLAIISFTIGPYFYSRSVPRPLRVGTVIEARDNGLLMSTGVSASFVSWSSINTVRPGRFYLEIGITGFDWPLLVLAQRDSQEPTFQEFAGACKIYMDISTNSEKSTRATVGGQPMLSPELESRACGLPGAGAETGAAIEAVPHSDRSLFLKISVTILGACVLIGLASFRLARISGVAPAKAAQLSSLVRHTGVLARRVFRRPYELFGIVHDDSSVSGGGSNEVRTRSETRP